MKTDAWMPLWIGDYLADTMHLTAAQHGAYLLLLMAHWRRPQGLPADPDFLAATARMTREQWLSEAKACLAFFTEKDGVLTHKRVVEERAKAQAKHAKLSAAGRKGGKAGLSEAQARLKQSQSHIDSNRDSSSVWQEPTREQVIEAGRNAGLTEQQTGIWYDEMKARDIDRFGRWLDSRGNPIGNWQYALSAWAGRFKENNRKGKSYANNGTSGASRIRNYSGVNKPEGY